MALGIRLAVMDMWRRIRTSTNGQAPQAAILFEQFHVLRHLGEALDKVRMHGYARLDGSSGPLINGQKYALLSYPRNPKGPVRDSFKLLLAANKRLTTACMLKESFGKLWDYLSLASVRESFDNLRAQLKGRRHAPHGRFAAVIEWHWDGLAANCRSGNRVSFGFVEGLNNRSRVLQSCAYGLRNEGLRRLSVPLACCRGFDQSQNVSSDPLVVLKTQS